MIYEINRLIINFFRRMWERTALRKFENMPDLQALLQDYIKKTNSTGCKYVDYWVLYQYIKQKRPIEILECGTGVSTVVMAYALMENENSNGLRGRITSIEESDEYFQQAIQLMPEKLRPYVDILQSEKKEFTHTIFRGVGYKDIPDRDYDFVFIDGPTAYAPSDSTEAFNFDFINIVKKSTKPVAGIIDNRKITCYVLQKIFGIEKVRFDAKSSLGFIHPCSREDIRSAAPGELFKRNIKLFGKNELKLQMTTNPLPSNKSHNTKC